jgi:hypothetical protein
MLEELTGCVYYDVGGFFERYIEEKTWTNKAGEYLRRVQSPVYRESLEWVARTLNSKSIFLERFMKFQDTVLSGLGRKYHTTKCCGARRLTASSTSSPTPRTLY